MKTKTKTKKIPRINWRRVAEANSELLGNAEFARCRAVSAVEGAVAAAFPDFDAEEQLEIFDALTVSGSPKSDWLRLRIEAGRQHGKYIRERLGFTSPQPARVTERRLDEIVLEHAAFALLLEEGIGHVKGLTAERDNLMQRNRSLESEWAYNYGKVLRWEGGGITVCEAVACLRRAIAHKITWRFRAAKWKVLGWWDDICDRVKGYFAAGPQGDPASCYKFLDNSARREETAKEVWECGPNGTLHPPRTYTSCNGKISPQADCQVRVNGVPINPS